MALETDRLKFEASANLQRLIGRELVPTDALAMVELVKNAYDAGAQNVWITIQSPSAREPGYIEIRDDGEGLALADFRRLFMVAGYSERPDQIAKGERVPLGEKGIGRFAADRLGARLSVLTKKREAKRELQVEIDWEAFRDKKKRFNEVTAPVKEVEPEEFPKGQRGAILRVTALRASWPPEKIQEIRASLAELIDPFQKPSDFNIEIVVPGSAKLTGPVTQAPPSGADIEIEFRVLKSGMIKRRVRGLRYPEDHGAEEVRTSAKAEALAGMTGRYLYWEKRPTKEHTQGLKPGVRLYRDGFRVEPFGSPFADWLGISEKRAKRAGHAHIVPSRLLGFVEISRQRNPDLQETTSRQALIDGDAARSLLTLLREQIHFLEERIRLEVAEPRWAESRRERAIEFERSRLQTLGIMAFGLAHELRQPLQSIRSEAENITTRLLQLQIQDPEITEAQKSIDQDIERIDKNISLVAEISKGNFQDIEEFDLAEVIRSECDVFKTRCGAINITLQTELPETQIAHFNKATVTTVLLNLVKNSIDAIEEGSREGQGRIVVRLSKTATRHRLEVTDNGTGIPEEVRGKIFKKFASKKTGGMGVGLYYCSAILTAHGGELAFESRGGVGTTFTAEFVDRGD